MVEYSGNKIARLILTGSWLYDNILKKTVRIYAINYDFYFDLDEGYNDADDKPELNTQGEHYVIMWTEDPFFKSFGLPSQGFLTVEAAKKYAVSVVLKINWDDPTSTDF